MKEYNLKLSRMVKKREFMKNREWLVLTVILLALLSGCKQEVTIRQGSFTSINPLSYTDVIYNSGSDTVLVSTFSGRIAERINGNKTENLVTNLSDEIYSLAVDSRNHRIYASTLNSGIAIIDSEKKSVIDHLIIYGSWISQLFLSKNGDVLAGRSANRKNYIWDLKNSPKPISLPENLLSYAITGVDESGNVIVKGNGKHIFWDPFNNTIEKEITVSGNLADIDSFGNMLLYDDKYFQYYNTSADTVAFRKNHEYWPYYWQEQDTIVKIPLQLSLTVGQLTDQFIFTAGVDRSIRKWSKVDGQQIAEITEHRATVSALDLSSDQSQLVSVDLKGGIHFHELNKADNKY